MEIIAVIILIWKLFIGAKLCQFVYNIGKTKTPICKILTDGFEIVIVISMIFFGFEIIEEVPTWEEFTRIGQYTILIVLWFIVSGLTSMFNGMIKVVKTHNY